MFWDPVRIEPPSSLPVTLAELKAQSRYFNSDEDAILTTHLMAAIQMCENYTYLGFLTQTWQQSFSAFPATGSLKLQRRPVQGVLSVSYLDSAGVEQPADPLTYQVAGIGNDHVCTRVRVGSSQTWPQIYDSTDAGVTVTYRVGFGDDWNAVPEQIRLAILYEASTYLGFRENVVMGTTVTELSFTTKSMLRDWRPLAVA
jgi:uncharacterized phiE125 gp8 family phage protein